MKQTHDAPKIQLKELISLHESRVAVIYTDWNAEIVQSLYLSCVSLLQKKKLKDKNLISIKVPGSFELPTAAKLILENEKVDAVICLGCIVKGETSHFEFISSAVTNAIMELNLKYNTPVIFGVITPHNFQQAKDRAGGSVGNKGAEAAVAAMQMIALNQKFKS